MHTQKFFRTFVGVAAFALLNQIVWAQTPQTLPPANNFYQAYVVAPSYDYELSGRKDRVKGYVVRLDAPERLTSPGLVILVSGVAPGEGHATVNGQRYNIPGQMGAATGTARDTEKNQPGKEGWYSFTSGDEIVAKIVIPVDPGHLRAGMNEIEFFKADDADGYDVIDVRLETVSRTAPPLIGQTYHLLGRGRSATIGDFDFVLNYKGEKKRSLQEIPVWARRGKVNFYRAGIDWQHLDRMFEMFKEAHINLVATNVPADTSSEEYRRVKAFIDRCHANNIRVTAFNSLGGIGVRELLMNPERQSWISRDEYGNMRWRAPNNTFAADLQNEEYRRNALRHAAITIDAGVDELYYDWSIGGTGDVIQFLDEVRQLAASKGRNVSIFGNCKGNILVDEVADLTKTEGTSEAGVWDGKWVHNIAQARFYYASGYGVKSYESKYEGADPGVPNPGARDIRDGMKAGWRKPIAEASAFQSHFAIAEAGQKLLHGWIMQDNPIANQTWGDISRYFTFLSDHQDLYTDVACVSKIGVISPPHIPSFEVSLKRDNLYNTLAESNVMYEVVLLHRLTPELLSPYKLIIIPDIPWMDAGQIAAIRAYKKAGGKVYTIGSSPELRELADEQSPAAMLEEARNEAGRRDLLIRIEQLSGEQVIAIPGVDHVAANVVKKTDSDRVILHFVNYDKPLKNVRVRLNLDGFAKQIDGKRIQLFSPDGGTKDLKVASVRGPQIELVLPELDVYDVVAIN
ncbi:MAG TPA: hypothetical protein VFM10_01095 [Terriglobales bacterium]|nr:hypothetical protein [Terriglobales bacterium]